MAKKTEGSPPPSEQTTTFTPAITFTGWPMPYAQNRKGVVFRKGIESEPVPESFLALMREKGLVAGTEPMAADTAAEATEA